MGGIVRFAQLWVYVRKFCFEMRESNPVAATVLEETIAKLPLLERIPFELASTIIPAARAEIEQWLAVPAVRNASGSGISDPTAALAKERPRLAVIRLWERFLLAGELGGSEARTRWLSEKSREEQLLLTRLSKRITLPES